MRYVLQKPVYFVGFMGAGKTSVARKLARKCGAASIDADVYLSRLMGMRSADMSAEYGEQMFRQQELEAMKELCNLGPAFVSMGGGAVESEGCRELLKQHGYVIYLRITAREAASRISNIKTRPLFGDIEQAQRLNEHREPLYEEVADFTIATSNQGVSGIAAIVITHLKSVGILQEYE